LSNANSPSISAPSSLSLSSASPLPNDAIDVDTVLPGSPHLHTRNEVAFDVPHGMCNQLCSLTLTDQILQQQHLPLALPLLSPQSLWVKLPTITLFLARCMQWVLLHPEQPTAMLFQGLSPHN
jgi:hypothetical protein